MLYDGAMSWLMALVTITSTIMSLMVTEPVNGLKVGVPNIHPVGAVGKAGSEIAHTVAVGMPLIVCDAPAARLTVPS